LETRWGLYTPELSYVLSLNAYRFGKISDPALLGLAICLSQTLGGQRDIRPNSIGLYYTLIPNIYESGKMSDPTLLSSVIL